MLRQMMCRYQQGSITDYFASRNITTPTAWSPMVIRTGQYRPNILRSDKHVMKYQELVY